jgi:hypothetical protein
MNTKKASDDSQVPESDATPKDVGQLDTDQMEEISGGVKTISWSGSDGDEA